MASAPNDLRRRNTAFWTTFVADLGGRWPHMASTSRSTGTTSPGRTANTARTARSWRPLSATGPVGPNTSRGPSRPTRSVAGGYRTPRQRPRRAPCQSASRAPSRGPWTPGGAGLDYGAGERALHAGEVGTGSVRRGSFPSFEGLAEVLLDPGYVARGLDRADGGRHPGRA